jgi:hypothetical protein
MRIIEYLTKELRSASVFNADVQEKPSCILWPDGERHWESVIPRLQIEMPELFQLGDYLPGKRIGPAIWLRCVIAGAIEGITKQADSTPILYLPGITRQDLRAVESCPEQLKPLAELQFRGVIWSQVNAKDWTTLAFLKSSQGGLGLDVAQDSDAKQSMQLALYRLLDVDLSMLRQKHLDKDYFNTLLSGGDPIRDVLQWLDQGDNFRKARDENQWRGFVEICKSQLGFDPENDGPLKAATLLANRGNQWENVWGRFCEAPARYASLPNLLRKVPLPGLFDDKSPWPQCNETEEKNLRDSLSTVGKLPSHEARQRIAELEEKHAERREWVWAELGESPLAIALKSLVTAAEVTSKSLASGTCADMAAGYQTTGWNADAAAIAAIAAVQKPEDLQAVQLVLQTIYVPWLDEAARHLQKEVLARGYPGGHAKNQTKQGVTDRQCIVFFDGLRLDLAHGLDTLLRQRGLEVELESAWAALPSVTATAKPAVTPVREHIRGQDVNADFEPSVASTGQSLKGGYHLKKLLTENGWQILERNDTGDPNGCAWTEVGDLDHEGHIRGAQLAKHVGSILSDIRDRIVQLLDAGWKSVRVVTDHGWLLVPGGLPKTELSSALSDNTWGRCAAIKPGAACDEDLYSWYWNIDLSFALAQGISCYRAGTEYTHGGLSLQECLVAFLNVTSPTASKSSGSIAIQDVAWKGLRCKVVINGNTHGLRLDIRTHAGNSSSSVTMNDRPFKEDGSASVVVEDDSLTDHEATIVILDAQGALVAQQQTVIGKEES